MANNFNNPSKTKLLPLTALAPMGSTTIRDLSSSYWFGPLQPIQPIAPAGFRPRQYGYQPGSNIMWTPRADEPISYDVLRELADSWDLLRIIITTQLDKVCAMDWEIRLKVDDGETKADHEKRTVGNPDVQTLKQFFAKPDGFHRWKQWLRMWLEDMIVVDAVALWMARDKDGKIATIHPLAGDTINRMLTDQGVTPPSGSVAYQQVLYGMPVWDFEVDDLLFHMRNERTTKRYGFSAVEQIIRTICFGIRRQDWQISEYTVGNVPEALVFLPSDLPIDRVKEVQDWFDSILASDLGQRRRVRFLPGYGTGDQAKPNVIFPKEPLLKDDLDVWLAQIACYCIGVSSQPFLKMMNRASAEEANDQADEDGRKPYLVSVKDIMDDIIQDKLGYPNCEFAWSQDKSSDPVKQAQADNIYAGKINTINEIRKRKGDDPYDDENADKLGTFTPSGFVALGEAPPPPPAATGPGGMAVASKPFAASPRTPAQKMLKSVGGNVTDVVRIAQDKVWVNTLDQSNDECAVYCNPQGELIEPGDSLWWQGGWCYWTPQDRSREDVQLPKIGYSGVPKPKKSVKLNHNGFAHVR